MKRAYTFITLIILSINCIAQSGKGIIKGTILDAGTGETLPGANVIIDGTQTGTSSDMDGNFTLHNIAPGTYKVVVSMMSFAKKAISGIVVEAGKPTVIKVSLESASQELNTVVIESEARRESLNALLLQQKNAVTVSDGISAETIKKTPDRSSSDVLKRVSGTTIQDNKFAIIRGLNDRYNSAYLNGSPLPSTESDRKAFSFDIFPAALLDNITIIKTATPDLPADFAGGIIQINTRAIPEKNTMSLSISSGYNTMTTFKPYVDYKGGKYDWIGMDDGSRKQPEGLPTVEQLRTYTPAQKADAAKLMGNNDWSLQEKSSAPLPVNTQFTLGNVGKLFKNEIGHIFSITYNNNYNFTETERAEFEEQGENIKPLKVFELNDTQYSNQILAGALSNLSYKIGGNNTISFKNMVNINSEDKVVIREGIRDYSNVVQQFEKSDVRWFTENRLITSQLQGDHFIKASKTKIKWTGACSDIYRSIPDLRRMVYLKNHNTLAQPGEQESQYAAAIATSGTSASYGGNMFWSTNNEKSYNGSMDVLQPLMCMPDNFRMDIKAGGYYHLRDRAFSARSLGFSKYKVGGSKRVNFVDSLLTLSEDSIFLPQNLGVISPYQPATSTSPKKYGKGGFKLEEGTKLNDTYYASSELYATYLMFDNKFLKKFRFVWGARMESYNMKIKTFEDDGDTVNVDTTIVDILPSGNLICSLSEKSNLRAAYYQTVSRPEFRELAPFGFFDYTSFYSYKGNPQLQRALMHNFDLRYEYFPGMGQIISASVFYKKFINAIEQVNSAVESRLIEYRNVPLVNTYGAELEYRLNFGWLLHKQDNKYLMNTSMFTNFAYIKSEVDVSAIQGSRTDSRPLQGQSPYIINGGAQYNDSDKGFGLSLAVNRIGRRIIIVGNDQEPDIFENPRTVLDLQVSKTFFKKLDIKINLRDALAKNIIFYQDLNKDGKYNADYDNTMAKTKVGSTYGLTIAYRFF